MESIYEIQNIGSEDYSCLYHVDRLRNETVFHSHWHENIELLNIVSGSAVVTLSGVNYDVAAGDTIVVNPNTIHMIKSKEDTLCYHVLIIEEAFYRKLGIDFDSRYIKEKIHDDSITTYFNHISNENCKLRELWKQAIMLKAGMLMITLYRDYSFERDKQHEYNDNSKVKISKDAIEYMRTHYTENISVENISMKIGVSLYHLCRCFREVTKTTPIKYLNYIRCINAKNYLRTGKYSVSEAAGLCGFRNMSYFTKTYKLYNGCNPSDDIVDTDKDKSIPESGIDLCCFGCYQ